MYPLLQHPERFVWDFWYHYDEQEQLFHLFFLNADPALAPANQHHFAAMVGHATTPDFCSIQWHRHDMFQARPDGWDNTSIWTGDIIRCRDGYAYFYTSRDRRVDDGLTQNVGLAVSRNLADWKRIEHFRLKPDTRWYEPRSVAGDDTIHAWRDPYLFRLEGHIYMLLGTKSNQHPPARKGSVGLLRSQGGSLLDWEAMPPLYSSGWVSECDVPLLYQHEGRLMLVYTGWAQFDHAPGTAGAGGLHLVAGEELLLAPQNFPHPPTVLVPESTGLYACRIIPELDGDIVGFDLAEGGLRRIAAATGFAHLDRDFTDIALDTLAAGPS